MQPAVSMIPARSPAARNRRSAYAIRWGASLAVLVALGFIHDGYVFLFVVALGPWLQLSIELSSGHYVLASLCLLWGAATAFLFPLAWVLYALPKRTALYLRRFQLAATYGAMSNAIEKGLGRRLRVVTLDDRSFSPLEAPVRVRRLTRWTPITLTLAIVGGFLAVTVFAGMRFAPTITDWIWGAVAISGFIVLPGIVAIALYLASLLAAFLLLRRRIRKRARLHIVGPAQIPAAISRVRLLAARWRGASILEPQATVVQVTDDAWQPTVQALIQETACVIFDVSQPTANVLWELEQVFNAASRHKVLLVADENLFQTWSATAGRDEMLARVQMLLQAHTILMYRGSGRLNRRRFRQNICRAIDAMA
jgi:hypothetical protein